MPSNDRIDCPEFAAIAQALALLESAEALDAEARHCLAEYRKPPPCSKALPTPLADALTAARAEAAARVLAQADAALWAAAGRCSRGWELNVGWQRIERELTASEWAAVCAPGRKGRRLQTAWRDAKRRGPPASGLHTGARIDGHGRRTSNTRY